VKARSSTTEPQHGALNGDGGNSPWAIAIWSGSKADEWAGIESGDKATDTGVSFGRLFATDKKKPPIRVGGEMRR
jgi:hypothetical protein